MKSHENGKTTPEESKDKEEKAREHVQTIQSADEIAAALQLFMTNDNSEALVQDLRKIKEGFVNFIEISKSDKPAEAKNSELIESSKSLHPLVISTLNNKEFSATKHDATELGDVLYEMALKIGEFTPRNETDFAHLCEIEPENRVITSDQTHYDVASLFQHLQKTSLDNLKNPFNRAIISERDKRTMLKAIDIYKQYTTEKFTLLTGNPHAHGDPDYEATMRLVDELRIPTRRDDPRIPIDVLLRFLAWLQRLTETLEMPISYTIK